MAQWKQLTYKGKVVSKVNGKDINKITVNGVTYDKYNPYDYTQEQTNLILRNAPYEQTGTEVTIL